MTCPHTTDVAAYALGTLDEPDRTRLRGHLPSCEECRAVLASVEGLPRLLARVPPDAVGPLRPRPSEAMFRDLVAAAVRSRRTRRRRLVAGLAVAAALLVGGVGAGVVLETRAGPGVQVVAGSAGGVRASVELLPAGSGTGLRMRLTGVPPLEHCRLVVVDRDGRREVAASWQATYSGTATIDGSTTVPAARLASLRIETDTQTLVTMPVPG